MGRFFLSFPLPLCKVIPRRIGVYETTESFNSLIKKTGSLKTGSYHQSKQYLADGSIKGRIRDREEHIDFFITTSRLHNQCETVCTLPEKSHRIP